MKSCKVALIQMDIILGQAEINRQRALQFIDEAVKRGAEIVALPELWTTGYDLINIKALAREEAKKNTIKLLCEKAKALKIDIVSGSILELDKDQVYNTCYYIDNQGNLLNSYRKIHLFGLMEEDKYLSPGAKTKVFETEFGKVGLMICYDIRFPELARKLTIEGAEALFIPAEFPHPRMHHWRSLNIARAIENQAFVFAINRVGSDGKSEFFGRSMIINPWGDIIAEGSEKEEIVIANVDFSEVGKVRKMIPCLKDRKEEYY